MDSISDSKNLDSQKSKWWNDNKITFKIVTNLLVLVIVGLLSISFTPEIAVVGLYLSLILFISLIYFCIKALIKFIFLTRIQKTVTIILILLILIAVTASAVYFGFI